MLCADCREELSARLDSEDDPRARPEVDAHLESCAACRQWLDDAARITRLARTGVAYPTPDLVEAVLARAPAARGAWLRAALRVVLALAGVGQVVLAATQIVGDGGGAGGGHKMDGASMLHFAHESAAWNLALGVGFVWVAWQVGRAAGLVPTLTAFILVLSTLAGLDFAHGRVDLARLSSHALLFVGYVAVLALAARETGSGGFFPFARGRPGELTRRVAAGSKAASARYTEPNAQDGMDLRPTARRDAA